VTSGNFIEMYDFFLFGFYATAISKAFFPASSEYASLMLTFATFGAGFLMRPVGAVVLGAYVDRVGRRSGLLLTLAIMAAGTALVAFVPGYASVGLLAPFLVLIGRLLQGLSAGVELGGVSVYLSEIATPGVAASTSAGSRPASSWPSWCRPCSAMVSTPGWTSPRWKPGAGACRSSSAA
jgi:MHS family citrate/tricarballylate:H+ symporter-like MFS transporter